MRFGSNTSNVTPSRGRRGCLPRPVTKLRDSAGYRMGRPTDFGVCDRALCACPQPSRALGRYRPFDALLHPLDSKRPGTIDALLAEAYRQVPGFCPEE